MQILLDKGILKNTRHGYENNNGFVVGYSRTRTKRYVEDKYADLAKKLMN